MFYIVYHVRLQFGDSEEARLWDAETQEAENDVASLSLSFLAVQALRYHLSGVLPHVSGLEVPQHRHSETCVLQLLGMAGVFSGVTVAIVVLVEPVARFFGEESYLKRALLVLQNVFAMSAAWCLLYAPKWGLAWLRVPQVFVAQGFKEDPNAPWMQVLLAWVVSMVAVTLIFILDKIGDMDATGKNTERIIKSIINAIGILVGFSWEQSFDGGVEAISDLTVQFASWCPVVTKLGLGIFVALVIVPAWRRHILRNVLHEQPITRQMHDRELVSASIRSQHGEREGVHRTMSVGFDFSEKGVPSRGAYAAIPS